MQTIPVDDDIHKTVTTATADGHILKKQKRWKMAPKAPKNRPGLDYSDVMMPEINGFDVAAILKNDPQTMDSIIIFINCPG